jgi:hypothetical protein
MSDTSKPRGEHEMNRKTTGRAEAESATKAAPAVSSKPPKRTETAGRAGGEPAPEAGSGRKRRKPFVL